MDERDMRNCENCKNYVVWDDRPEIKSCRKWECEYEPIDEEGEINKHESARIVCRDEINRESVRGGWA